MAGADFAKWRRLSAAAIVVGHWTARSKWTTGWRVNRRRDIAGQNDALPPGFRIDRRHGRNHGFGIRMFRLEQQSFGFSRFHDFSQVHHHDAMADVLDHREIVSNE